MLNKLKRSVFKQKSHGIDGESAITSTDHSPTTSTVLSKPIKNAFDEQPCKKTVDEKTSDTDTAGISVNRYYYIWNKQY